MAKVLLGWEFGQNFGHLAVLAPVAQALEAEGHEVVLAVRDLYVAAARLRLSETRATVIQAPFWVRPIAPVPPIVTFADVMVFMGFLEPPRVRASLSAWRELLAIIDPDLVVVESAPLLALAAMGRPLLALGVGYTLLPRGPTLPPLQPWTAHVPVPSLDNEQRVLESVRAAAAEERLRVPERLSDLWSAPAFVCSLPEMDVYARYRQPGDVVGPLVPLAPRSSRAALPPPGARPFVYLGAEYPRLGQVLAALAAATGGAEAYIRDASPVARRAMAARYPRIMFHTQPVSMVALGARATSLIHHGGQNSCADGLQLGLPQLTFPGNTEQSINAQLVARVEAGLPGPELGAPPAVFARALAQCLPLFLSGAALAVGAARVAAAIAARPPLGGLDAVLRHVRAQLA